MREDQGFDERQCYAFDIAVISYGRRLEYEENRTKMENAPHRRKGARAKIPVPYWEKEDLLRFRGLDPEVVEEKRIDRDVGIQAIADDILKGNVDWL